MKQILTIAALVIIASLPLYSATISGYVVDDETGETIIGMNVVVKDTELGSATDTKGFFTIQRVPVGQATLIFSHIAYEEKSRTVSIGRDDIFLGNVAMQPTAIQGEAIEVSGRRGQIIAPETDIASFQVEPIVLKEVPQLNKDVFQVIKYSPSVTISDAISPLYYVRGGSSGENLVQLDGMTIYNPQHALSMQAIFNPYAIKNIEVLMGGFDAEYGGRNSSILHIATREGHQDEVHGEFRPSTSGIVGAVEFPVKPGGTAMVSGRLLSSLTDKIIMGIPNVMADLNAAYQVTHGRSKLRFSTFYARDYMNYDFARFSLYFDEPVLRNMSVGFNTSTSNLATGLQSRIMLNPDLVWESHIYYSGFDVDNTNFVYFDVHDTTENVDLILDYRTRVRNRVSDFTMKSNVTAYTPYLQTLKLGYEGTFYRLRNRVGEIGTASADNRLKPELHALYLQDKLKVGRFIGKAGVRMSRFWSRKEWLAEPRVSAVFRFRKASLKFAWGRYYQYITTMNSQDYELSQFLDYYYPLGKRTPLTSIHHIAGLDGRLSEYLDYTITAYYKWMPTLYRFDYSSTARSIYAYQAVLEKGEGEAYGIEFLFKGSWGRLSGWAGYSWSRATRRYPSIMDRQTYLYDGDQPHNIKAVALYNFTEDITGSMTFQLTSGFPKTWEVGQLSHYNYNPMENSYGIYPINLTPAKNNVRYPPRLVMDIGWKKQLRSGIGHQLAEYLGSEDAYFTLTAQNLLFLWRNPWMYFYIPDYGYYGYDFLPVPIVAAGYVIKF